MGVKRNGGGGGDGAVCPRMCECACVRVRLCVEALIIYLKVLLVWTVLKLVLIRISFSRV